MCQRCSAPSEMLPYKIVKNNKSLKSVLANYASKENKCTLFVVIHQVKRLIATAYRPQEKNMQIILNALWIFIIIHHFCLATFQSARYGTHAIVNAYLSFQSIYLYNVNLSIKKIFRCKIYVSTLIQCLILCLFLISML